MLLYTVAPQMQFRKDLRKTSYDSFYKVNLSLPLKKRGDILYVTIGNYDIPKEVSVGK